MAVMNTSYGLMKRGALVVPPLTASASAVKMLRNTLADGCCRERTMVPPREDRGDARDGTEARLAVPPYSGRALAGTCAPGRPVGSGIGKVTTSRDLALMPCASYPVFRPAGRLCATTACQGIVTAAPLNTKLRQAGLLLQVCGPSLRSAVTARVVAAGQLQQGNG
jgi:hypothetical protein